MTVSETLSACATTGTAAAAHGCVHIFSVGSEHTTARYFEHVLRAERRDVRYWQDCPDLRLIRADDHFVFVDPAPAWPLGLERLPCATTAYLIDTHQGLQWRLDVSQFFDNVLVAQKDDVAAFVAAGHPNARWLPLACAPDIHSQAQAERDIDVGFVGKLGQSGSRRHDILTRVLPRFRTNDYRTFQPPRAMGAIYGRSKIVFNASINGDLNMRVFEALAAGALLVTDRIGNGLGDLFQEGIHYVGYASADEAIEAIAHHLAHPAERERIAAAGMQLALARHTYAQRWRDLEAAAAQGRRGAPARSLGRGRLGTLYARVFAGLRQPGRIFPVARRYGLTPTLVATWANSCLRWLNSRVPLTPNAIRARFG